MKWTQVRVYCNINEPEKCIAKNCCPKIGECKNHAS